MTDVPPSTVGRAGRAGNHARLVDVSNPPALPWYDDSGGTGPVVVLLHAFPLSSRMWERVVTQLEDETRVVRIDLPGLGRSAPWPGEPSMSAMAAAVVAVLDHLALGWATLVGISTGGYVALEVARTRPDRVDGLVLGSTTCWLTEPDVPGQRRELADELDRLTSVEPVLGAADEGLGETARLQQPDLHDLLVEVISGAQSSGVAWAARAIASRQDTSEVLTDHEGPVLLLFGDEDTATPPERGSAMAELRPRTRDTRLVVLEQTGHLSALEQPDRFAEALLGWLRARV